MDKACLLLLVAAELCLFCSTAWAEPRSRDGKVISLFNVVQFRNEDCQSTSRSNGAASGTTYRNGTCYTSSECKDKGGQSSGSCAAGFGVCCVFILTKSGERVNNNCTYIQNPGYPNTYSETSTVTYSINKCSDQVCSIRLDFESFTIQGPADTEELATSVCQDTFSVRTVTGFNVPTICGQNTGQHMYVDIGRSSGDSVTLDFAFSGTFNSRSWEIKVSQIKCSDELLPPEGCLQYHVSTNGRFETFNYQSTDEIHPPTMEYNVCIRQEMGMCCVRYQTCPETLSFSLDTKPMNMATLAAPLAGTDSFCTDDFIRIDNSGSECRPDGFQKRSINKYCGTVLSPFRGGMVNAPVCDCSGPFMVGIRAISAADGNDAAMPPVDVANTVVSRGACLTFEQLPC